MSIKTVRFRRKLAQIRRVNAHPSGDHVPTARVKSDGRTTIFGQVDSMDEDGHPMKAGKRYPGRATGKVCCEPMKPDKANRLLSLK